MIHTLEGRKVFVRERLVSLQRLCIPNFILSHFYSQTFKLGALMTQQRRQGRMITISFWLMPPKWSERQKQGKASFLANVSWSWSSFAIALTRLTIIQS